jgi:Na+/alanine symporter
MGELKNSLVAAVSSSIALVCMLLVFVLNATKETKSDIVMIILLLAILLLTVSAIVQWLRYLRRYVNFAIEQNLKEIIKKPED